MAPGCAAQTGTVYPRFMQMNLTVNNVNVPRISAKSKNGEPWRRGGQEKGGGGVKTMTNFF